MQTASLVVQSIIDFIKGGSPLNYTSTVRACSHLDHLSTQLNRLFTSVAILHSLIPPPIRPCQGFAELVLVLLSCNIQDIILSGLRLLRNIVLTCPEEDRFDFLETGFITLIPSTFYHNNLRLRTDILDLWLGIVCSFLSYGTHHRARSISQTKRITISEVRQAVYLRLVQPLSAFWTFLFNTKSRFVRDTEIRFLPALLCSLLQISPSHAQTTQFVFSVPVCFTLTSRFVWMEQSHSKVELIDGLKFTIREWASGCNEERQQGKNIMFALREEGIADEIELQTHFVGFDYGVMKNIYTAAYLLLLLGGNTPFLI
ncbi:hypothetical protein BLNAU_1378 [Blattamonas nauphoetae]|uniref:Uncharacterized protein n=1 Tax=Blattamonas nauphoetae TaxID=2049346 RepID=A0ABQ9YJ65_9EUKA|nr:hypothetical protein BLNAU_1378 [Blattamonas nauphoetae]